MPYEPLHHKYRPQTFADLVGQDAIATTLTNAIQQERIAPAYLLTGPRGTGKTSSARIFAKSLNCLTSHTPTATPCGQCEVCRTIAMGSALDVIEIDAASNTGVDNIREIIERAQFAPVQCRYKVYIIDEVHMLSQAAFNALLKTLEEPPKHVVFVLATTDPQRVLPTIISRCQRFDFRRIPLDAMVKHLGEIAAKEGIHISIDALTLVAQVAQGGLRDAESLLDQLSLLSGQVTVERVWDLVGAVPERDLMAMLEAIAADNSTAVLERTRQIMDRGREPLTVLQNLAGFYRDLLIAKTAPNRPDLVACTQMTWEWLCEAAKRWNAATILTGQERLRASEVQIKNTTQPRLWLEVTFLGLLPSALGHQPSANQVAISTNGRYPVSELKPLVSDRAATVVQPTTPAIHPPTQEVLPVKPSEKPIADESPAPRETVIPLQEMGSSIEEPAPTVPLVYEEENTAEGNSLEEDEQPVIPVADLSQIWQQALAYLEPISTRELLRQLGRLIEFDGTVAHVGVPPKWGEKLQPRLNNIEVAFQRALNSRVKVVLAARTRLKSENTTESVAPSVSQSSNGSSTATVSHFEVTSPPIAPSNAPREPDQESIPISEPVVEVNPSPPPPVPPVSELSTPVIESGTPLQNRWEHEEAITEATDSTLISPVSEEVDEVAIAAQYLEEFFKGQMIKLTDNLDVIDSSAIQTPQSDAKPYLDRETALASDAEDWQDDEDDSF